MDAWQTVCVLLFPRLEYVKEVRGFGDDGTIGAAAEWILL